MIARFVLLAQEKNWHTVQAASAKVQAVSAKATSAATSAVQAVRAKAQRPVVQTAATQQSAPGSASPAAGQQEQSVNPWVDQDYNANYGGGRPQPS